MRNRPVRKVLAIQAVKKLTSDEIRVGVSAIINRDPRLRESDRRTLMVKYRDLREELASRIG